MTKFKVDENHEKIVQLKKTNDMIIDILKKLINSTEVPMKEISKAYTDLGLILEDSTPIYPPRPIPQNLRTSKNSRFLFWKKLQWIPDKIVAPIEDLIMNENFENNIFDALSHVQERTDFGLEMANIENGEKYLWIPLSIFKTLVFNYMFPLLIQSKSKYNLENYVTDMFKKLSVEFANNEAAKNIVLKRKWGGSILDSSGNYRIYSRMDLDDLNDRVLEVITERMQFHYDVKIQIGALGHIKIPLKKVKNILLDSSNVLSEIEQIASFLFIGGFCIQNVHQVLTLHKQSSSSTEEGSLKNKNQEFLKKMTNSENYIELSFVDIEGHVGEFERTVQTTLFAENGAETPITYVVPATNELSYLQGNVSINIARRRFIKCNIFLYGKGYVTKLFYIPYDLSYDIGGNTIDITTDSTGTLSNIAENINVIYDKEFKLKEGKIFTPWKRPNNPNNEYLQGLVQGRTTSSSFEYNVYPEVNNVSLGNDISLWTNVKNDIENPLGDDSRTNSDDIYELYKRTLQKDGSYGTIEFPQESAPDKNYLDIEGMYIRNGMVYLYTKMRGGGESIKMSNHYKTNVEGARLFPLHFYLNNENETNNFETFQDILNNTTKLRGKMFKRLDWLNDAVVQATESNFTVSKWLTADYLSDSEDFPLSSEEIWIAYGLNKMNKYWNNMRFLYTNDSMKTFKNTCWDILYPGVAKVKQETSIKASPILQKFINMEQFGKKISTRIPLESLDNTFYTLALFTNMIPDIEDFINKDRPINMRKTIKNPNDFWSNVDNFMLEAIDQILVYKNTSYNKEKRELVLDLELLPELIWKSYNEVWNKPITGHAVFLFVVSLLLHDLHGILFLRQDLATLLGAKSANDQSFRDVWKENSNSFNQVLKEPVVGKSKSWHEYSRRYWTAWDNLVYDTREKEKIYEDLKKEIKDQHSIGGNKFKAEQQGRGVLKSWWFRYRYESPVIYYYYNVYTTEIIFEDTLTEEEINKIFENLTSINRIVEKNNLKLIERKRNVEKVGNNTVIYKKKEWDGLKKDLNEVENHSKRINETSRGVYQKNELDKFNNLINKIFPQS